MQYEIIDKVTEVCTPVTLKESATNNEGGSINDTVTVVREDGTEVVFNNPNASGELYNEQYAIREVGTHAQADGTGTVEITEAGVENVDVVEAIVETPVAENIDTTADVDPVVETSVVETTPTE